MITPTAVRQLVPAVSVSSPMLRAESMPNGTMMFHVGVPGTGRASLGVYNARGERVAVVLDSYLSAGVHNFSWSKPVREGIYIAKLSAGLYNVSCELFR
jgi:hypothetical protein